MLPVQTYSVQQAHATEPEGGSFSSDNKLEDEQPWQRDPDALKKAASQYRKRGGATPGIYDFGSKHVHGQHPALEHTAVNPNLPAKSGVGFELRPPRLHPGSCVPPAMPEPLKPPPPNIISEMQMHDHLRIIQPGLLINRVIYDCLEPRPLIPSDSAELCSEPYSSKEEQISGARQGDSLARLQSVASSVDGMQELLSAPAGQDVDGLQARPASSRWGSNGSCAGSARSHHGRGTGPAGPEHRTDAAAQGTAAVLADDRESGSSSGTTASGTATYARQFDYYSDMPAWYSPQGPGDTTLVFESRFECGNLRRAIQVYQYEYDLVIRPDINTRRHTQWFFFAISNLRPGIRYKLNIINMQKESSLHCIGLQPLIHSACTMATQGVGWHHGGERVAYYENSIKRRRGKKYSTLSFTLQCQHEGDLLHVTHCYPYSYTDLQHHLQALQAQPSRQSFIQRSTLCSTLAGNAVDVLTITAPCEKADVLRKRKGILVSARVHPGETNASWMMKGLLDYLTGPSPAASQLRSMFVFKIIPMLNPDGVIVGNYRCSLAGVDLNRVWNEPNRRLHPTIHAAKALLKAFTEERQVVLFCDFHGHSRKRDIFVYGCQKMEDKDTQPIYPGYPNPGSIGGHPVVPIRLQDKLLPLLLYHNAPDMFSYHNCAFKVQKSKAGTGRVVGFRELGLVNSFTLEASFAGPSTGRWAGQHFTPFHYEQMGAAVASAVLDYWDPQQYGLTELMAELEFLHPPGMDEGRHCIRTASGQLIEVDDGDDNDDGATDSGDDDSSEEDDARRAARQQYQAASGHQAAGDASQQPLSRKQKRAQKAAQLRALLKEEQAKAAEGVMACLPLIGGQLDPQASSGAVAASYMQPSGYSKVPTAAALEYARSRGIYKGEALSWANSGMPLNPQHIAAARTTEDTVADIGSPLSSSGRPSAASIPAQPDRASKTSVDLSLSGLLGSPTSARGWEVSRQEAVKSEGGRALGALETLDLVYPSSKSFTIGAAAAASKHSSWHRVGDLSAGGSFASIHALEDPERTSSATGATNQHAMHKLQVGSDESTVHSSQARLPAPPLPVSFSPPPFLRTANAGRLVPRPPPSRCQSAYGLVGSHLGRGDVDPMSLNNVMERSVEVEALHSHSPIDVLLTQEADNLGRQAEQFRSLKRGKSASSFRQPMDARMGMLGVATDVALNAGARGAAGLRAQQDSV